MHPVFPAPVIVVGVGRFGLATLERLGDDWSGLRLSGADVSIGNLRLLAVRSADTVNGWRSFERDTVRIAGHLGDSDLPSLALSLAIIRSLGLIRYRDGCYQVALPRDAGVVEVDVEAGAPEADGAGEVRVEKQSRRLRYFEWLRLDPDPIVAAERLHHLAQRLQEVDLFITPLLNRIRQGHSPHTLLACLDRCRSLLEGRDPAPWDWGHPDERPDGVRVPVSDLIDSEEKAEMRRAAYFLEKVMEPPLPRWNEWLRGEEDAPPVVRKLEPFVRQPGDLASPLDPAELLGREWEVTGWASEQGRSGDDVFTPLTPHPFQLGLFDQDDREGLPEPGVELLADRLREFGRFLHSGLLRLWVDLQRERVEDPNVNVLEQARQRDELTEALRQSLEVLGQIVVHPLKEARREDGERALREVPRRSSGSAAEMELPGSPSRFLLGLNVEDSREESPRQWLERRLAQLGFEPPQGSEEELPGSHPLFADVCLTGDGEGMERRAKELFAPLREALNRQVRELYGFRFLTRYRNRPTRQPPRLTVFVIGDMSEAFTREAMRHVLREMHAELLRAFTPIFESYRLGFDRCLCVTPILWMPHPADPFQGEDLEVSRCEEAAIIDAVHGIRRWVECVLPPGRRSISQVFINSRVTDTATLSLADALRQTRDFLSFQIRNDLSQDPWLRQTSMSAGGGDLFSSFACYEIDFPALRSREYLANRLARECLAELKQGENVRIEPPEPLTPPDLDQLAAPAREVLGEVTRQAGESLSERIRNRVPLLPATPSREILEAFNERFEIELKREVWARWRELTGRLGRVDELIDELRLVTSRLEGKAVERVRSYSDHLIEDYAGAGGLKAAQAAFHQLRMSTQGTFQEQEKLRRDREALCGRHPIPELAPLSRSRRAVLVAAERKPDLDPIHLGLALWGLLSFVLGAPLAQSLSYLFGLHLRPGLLEWLLGPAGGLTGGLILWGSAWALLRWFLHRRFRALAAAIESLAEEVRALFWGAGGPPEREGRASVRSFLESRLELTGAVATRGFATIVFERALADAQLAYRLARSLDVQSAHLGRKSEELGVRATLGHGSEGREDLRSLFEGRDRTPADRLIDPEKLHGYFERRIGDDLLREVPGLIRAAGGLSSWREQACLTETERILKHCRARFDDLVREPISDQHFFAGEVGPRLVRFVSRYYANLGFGAGFKGYEGLDPDNVHLLADATLVIHSGLEDLFRETRQELRKDWPMTETLELHTAGVRPNVAYMLSLVQGIRVHSLRNLRRFESFHNRPTMPEDRMFPLSQEPQSLGSPVNPLTGYEEVGRNLAATVLGLPEISADHD
ncbi:MAG TPA: hypothetical protein VJ725_14435 [Thermoanaerobaculia bacterium]|nr:hypothetical protein [Thermoanaerobaculia bacterium]